MADTFTRRGFLRLMGASLALPALESVKGLWAGEPPAVLVDGLVLAGVQDLPALRAARARRVPAGKKEPR